MKEIDIFKWNGTWSDGKDHTGETGEEQFFMRVCDVCGKRRGMHYKKGIGYPALCYRRLRT